MYNKKSQEKFSPAGSSAKLPLLKQKLVGVKTLDKCVYKIWELYMIFEVMNAEKGLWPIFGCKVGQSVPIGMKLEHGVCHRLLDVYSKFQIDISKHAEIKKPGKFQKIQNAHKIL